MQAREASHHYGYFPMQFLPEDGITIFGSLLHTHVIGKMHMHVSLSIHAMHGMRSPLGYNQDKFADPET